MPYISVLLRIVNYTFSGHHHGIIFYRTFRGIWDIIITALLAFISMALPFDLAFNNDMQWSPACPDRWPGVESSMAESVPLRISPMQAVMYAIDGFFAVDILYVPWQRDSQNTKMSSHVPCIHAVDLQDKF